MHCTTCETFLGLRGDDCRGVHAVEANYGTETARVVYDPEEIERAELTDALTGYGYALWFRDGTPMDDDAAAGDRRSSSRNEKRSSGSSSAAFSRC